MKIEKEIVAKIPRDYLFVSGILDVDAKYFKRRIEEGVKASSINYQTNVYGKHTEWEFFNKDKEFNVLLFQMIDHLETLTIDLQRFYLKNAWGIIEGIGEYTQRHHHEPNYISGVIYFKILLYGINDRLFIISNRINFSHHDRKTKKSKMFN